MTFRAMQGPVLQMAGLLAADHRQLLPFPSWQATTVDYEQRLTATVAGSAVFKAP